MCRFDPLRRDNSSEEDSRDCRSLERSKLDEQRRMKAMLNRVPPGPHVLFGDTERLRELPRPIEESDGRSVTNRRRHTHLPDQARQRPSSSTPREARQSVRIAHAEEEEEEDRVQSNPHSRGEVHNGNQMSMPAEQMDRHSKRKRQFDRAGVASTACDELQAMGFSAEDSLVVLQLTGYNVQKAAHLLVEQLPLAAQGAFRTQAAPQEQDPRLREDPLSGYGRGAKLARKSNTTDRSIAHNIHRDVRSTDDLATQHHAQRSPQGSSAGTPTSQRHRSRKPRRPDRRAARGSLWTVAAARGACEEEQMMLKLAMEASFLT